MVDEILGVFKTKYKENGDKMIIDKYIPKDGTYILVDYNTWEIKKKIEIKYDKKSKEILGSNDKEFEFIKACDYYSSLLDMNKPMDPKKVIHSNQFYAFFIKKNTVFEKLTDEILNGYKTNILEPKEKYKTKESLEIYTNISKELEPIDTELGEKIFEWIRNNIFILAEKYKKETNYLKIFFISSSIEETIEKYKNEYKRYIIPNIYNSNSYNLKIGDMVYGLSNNNMGLNSKKPYLENKTRKIKVPYLVSTKEILLQKSLYDYLFILAKLGKTFVYFDDNKILEGREPHEIPVLGANYLLKISYTKNVEIKSFEIISSIENKENFNFKLEDIMDIGDKNDIDYGNLDWKNTRNLISKLFFNGIFSKISNSYDEEIDIKDGELKKLVINYRGAFHRWLYLGDDNQLKSRMERLLIDSILFSIKNDYITKSYTSSAASLAETEKSKPDTFNYLRGANKAMDNKINGRSNVMEEMERVSKIFNKKVLSEKEWIIENDEEYAYAIGQFLAFLNLKKNSKNKNANFLKEILTTNENTVLKEKLVRLFKRNSHNINTGSKNLMRTIGEIMEYSPKNNMSKVTNYLIAGFSKSIIFFEKGDINNETNE